MPTVGKVLLEYAADHLSQIVTGEERRRQLDRILKQFVKRPMEAVGQRELILALDGWDGPTRNRYRSALTHFWRWSRQRGYTELRPELDGHREPSRDVVLSIDTLRVLYSVAPARGDWRGFCRLLILTGARTGEVAGMRPEHVPGMSGKLPDIMSAKLADIWWRQPKTKNGTEHLVYLGPLALAELRHGATFPWAGKTTFADMKRRWSLDAGLDPESWRLHDIRRSFATHLVEGGADPAVVDRHLNHVASATARGVARVYNRAQLLEARKALALRWEGLLRPSVPAGTDGPYRFTLPPLG